MANWTERLKRKYWDGDAYCGDMGGMPFFGYHTPWPKQFWLEHRGEIKRAFWTAFFGVIAAMIVKTLV